MSALSPHKLSDNPPPDSVRLVDDFLDLYAGVGFPAGTVLLRTSSGQYAPEGSTLGDPCVWGYAAFDEASCAHYAYYPGKVTAVHH